MSKYFKLNKNRNSLFILTILNANSTFNNNKLLANVKIHPETHQSNNNNNNNKLHNTLECARSHIQNTSNRRPAQTKINDEQNATLTARLLPSLEVA